MVIDVDEAGALEALPGYQPLPATYTVQTGRASGEGRHFYFTLPPNTTVRDVDLDSASKPKVTAKYNGYVMLPGSIHESGNNYIEINPSTAIAELPDWLLERISSPDAAASNAITHTNGLILAGQRHNTFLRRACSLRGRGMDEQAITTILLKEWERCQQPPNCNHEFTTTELKGLIESACKKYPPGPYKVDSNLSLEDYLLAARNKNNGDFGNRVKFLTATFTFARLVKARKEFAGMDGATAAQLIEGTAGNIWANWFNDICDDPRAQFVTDWNAVNASSAGDAFDEAWEASQIFPVTPSHNISGYYRQCVSFWAELQRRAGIGNPFPFPQARAGEKLGVTRAMVGLYVKTGIQDGLLQRTKNYVRGVLASEYVYSGPGLTLAPEALAPEGIHDFPHIPHIHQINRIGESVSGAYGESGKEPKSGFALEVEF